MEWTAVPSKGHASTRYSAAIRNTRERRLVAGKISVRDHQAQVSGRIVAHLFACGRRWEAVCYLSAGEKLYSWL